MSTGGQKEGRKGIPPVRAILRHWGTALPGEDLESSGQAPKLIQQLCVFLRFCDFWSSAPGIKKTLP